MAGATANGLSLYRHARGIAIRRTASLPLAYLPGTHVFLPYRPKKRAWMAGTSPAMTALEGLLGGSLSRNCCP